MSDAPLPLAQCLWTHYEGFARICSSSFPWSSTCWKISFGYHISNICFAFSPSLSPLYLSLAIVSPTLSFPDIAPCSLLASTPPPVPSPLLSVSSSKWVFRCQCQSVGGGDESVGPTVSLAMTISAHCLVSVGGTFSTLCTIDLSSHHYTSQQFVNMMGTGVSVKKCLFISAYLTFLLCHIRALCWENSHVFVKTCRWASDIEDESTFLELRMFPVIL